MKSYITPIRRSIQSLAYLLPFILIFNACDNKQSKSNLRNQYINDLESYDGWQGINGYYYLKRGDAHSGQHSMQTDSVNIYGLTFVKAVKELSENRVAKINVSIWVKCLGTPASGSYIVSLEQGANALKYFSFDLKEKDVVLNEWVQISGSAVMPAGLPDDALVKIYFWNKSKSVILIDDFEFRIEN